MIIQYNLHPYSIIILILLDFLYIIDRKFDRFSILEISVIINMFIIFSVEFNVIHSLDPLLFSIHSRYFGDCMVIGFLLPKMYTCIHNYFSLKSLANCLVINDV